MSDFNNGFWPSYVTIITILSLVFCLFLLIANSRKPPTTADNTTGHVWDDDIREANNPLPRWWMGLYLLTVIFGVIYLALYPGLGSYAGLYGWTSEGRYLAERKAIDDALTPIYAGFQGKSWEQLAADPSAMAIGERIFLNNCATCHGSDARGSKGFPNLTDKDWLWGGDVEQIRETITKGRTGVMPPMAAAIGGSTEIDRLTQYVLSLSGSESDSVKAALGKPLFTACAACHGPKGEGNPVLGAPNLTDRIWLHGGGAAAIQTAINEGRTNSMPAHADKLTQGQIEVLAAYVKSLSNR